MIMESRDSQAQGAEKAAVILAVNIAAYDNGLAAVRKLHQVQHHQHSAVGCHPVRNIDIWEMIDLRILVVGHEPVFRIRDTRSPQESIRVHMLEAPERGAGSLHIRFSALNQSKIGTTLSRVIGHEKVFDTVFEDSVCNLRSLFELGNALGTEQPRQQNCGQDKSCMTEYIHYLYNTARSFLALITSSSGKDEARSLIRSSWVYCSLS